MTRQSCTRVLTACFYMAWMTNNLWKHYNNAAALYKEIAADVSILRNAAIVEVLRNAAE